MTESALQDIWQAIERIPFGSVMSYGEVARRAGLPRRARLVGHALKAAPEERELPWHRVVRADGAIAFPAGSRMHTLQSRKLRAEGVVVRKGRVVRKLNDERDLDAWLWGPANKELK